MAKEKKHYVVSMAVALELIEKATEFFRKDETKRLQFISTVIMAVRDRRCVTADFFSYYGEAGEWMYGALKAAMERSDRAREAAARRKMRKGAEAAGRMADNKPEKREDNSDVSGIETPGKPHSGDYAASKHNFPADEWRNLRNFL